MLRKLPSKRSDRGGARAAVLLLFFVNEMDLDLIINFKNAKEAHSLGTLIEPFEEYHSAQYILIWVFVYRIWAQGFNFHQKRKPNPKP